MCDSTHLRSEPLTIDRYLKRLGYNLERHCEADLELIRRTAWKVGPETLAIVSELDDRFPGDVEVPLRYLEPYDEHVHACCGWIKRTDRPDGAWRSLTTPGIVDDEAPDDPRILACVDWWALRTEGPELHRVCYPHSPHFKLHRSK